MNGMEEENTEIAEEEPMEEEHIDEVERTAIEAMRGNYTSGEQGFEVGK